MKNHLFAFIDTETTGFNPDKHELIEIAGIVVEMENPRDLSTYHVIEEFEYKIHPERIHDADPAALRVNHYDPSRWTHALTLEAAMKLVGEKTTGAVMVSHNISFDAGFVDKAFRLSGMANPMHYHRIDTVSMAHALLQGNQDVDHLSLRSLCHYFGIVQDTQHEALADTRALFELYKKLMTFK